MVGLSDAMREMMARKKASYAKGGDKAYKLKEGKTRIRVLPFEIEQNGETKIWADFGVHWIKTSKNGKPAAVVGNSLICHGAASQVEAMVDEALSIAKDQGDEAMVELFQEMRARKAVLINALIQDGADKSDAPKLVELTPSCWGDALGTILTYHEEGVDILDLNEGSDFIIERAGKGLDTTYTVMTAPKASKVAKDVMSKCIDPLAYIEKEFFRGDEPKAFMAISNLTGLPAPGAPKTSLLTSTAASRPAALSAPKATPAPASRKALATVVEDAPVIEDVVPEEPIEEAAPEVPAEDDEEAALEAALAAARAKKAAAAKATPAAKPTAKPAAAKPAAKVMTAPPTAPDTFGEPLESDEIEAALADLDKL